MNCKSKITLSGESETHRYEIETPIFWSEGDKPARQTINREENIALIFFRQGKSDTDHYVRFPSENGWPDYSTLSEESLQSYREQADGATASVTKNKINIETLSEVKWKQASIKITAQNADAVEADVHFQWGNGNDVSVEVEQIHGSVLPYWRYITNHIKNRLHIFCFTIFSLEC